MCVRLLYKINTFYSRESTRVSAPVRGSARQTSGDMFKPKTRLQFSNTKDQNETLPSDMPRRLRSPLEANKEEGTPRSWPARESNPRRSVVKPRVNESKLVSEQETSDSNAHSFHFSTVANQQTTAI